MWRVGPSSHTPNYSTIDFARFMYDGVSQFVGEERKEGEEKEGKKEKREKGAGCIDERDEQLRDLNGT